MRNNTEVRRSEDSADGAVTPEGWFIVRTTVVFPPVLSNSTSEDVKIGVRLKCVVKVFMHFCYSL